MPDFNVSSTVLTCFLWLLCLSFASLLMPTGRTVVFFFNKYPCFSPLIYWTWVTRGVVGWSMVSKALQGILMNKRRWDFLYRGTELVLSCVSAILGLKRWQQWEFWDSGQPVLRRKFQASLSYSVRLSHKKKKPNQEKKYPDKSHPTTDMTQQIEGLNRQRTPESSKNHPQTKIRKGSHREAGFLISVVSREEGRPTLLKPSV